MADRFKASEMKLGDTVKLFDGPFGYGVVNQIAEGQVHIFRPYATTADFSYGEYVTPYVGIENFSLFTSSDNMYEVPERKKLR